VEEVRRYGRSLALGTTNRHCLARLNPVTLRRQHDLGECAFKSLSFEGIWLDTEFSTGTGYRHERALCICGFRGRLFLNNA
jgi:hypothetical protein